MPYESLDAIKRELGNIPFGEEKTEETETKGVGTETDGDESVAGRIMREVHKQAVISTVKGDKDVQERIINQAREDVKVGMESLHQEGVKRLQDKTYDANREACECFGIDQGVPLWQIGVMKVLHDIWFIIYLVFAFVTICPVNVFCRGIKKFIKSNWLVVVVGILVYVLILTMPLIIPRLSGLIRLIYNG